MIVERSAVVLNLGATLRETCVYLIDFLVDLVQLVNQGLLLGKFIEFVGKALELRGCVTA